jgi:hypothetical protein
MGLLFFGGCKTSEDAANQYTLTVTVAQGVSGTPAAGSTGHAEGDVINYNYALQAGYENLVVKLDGAAVASSGVVTMNMNHTLTVTADKKFDPSGQWTGDFGGKYISTTFSGDYTSGTVSGTIDGLSGGGNGNYSLSDSHITFDLYFPAHGFIYFWGTITDNDHMQGDFTYCGGGSWTLTRQ